MKKYADVSKVVYDPKGTDPFTFRWYDPDEVIAGKKMREHLKFALSYCCLLYTSDAADE